MSRTERRIIYVLVALAILLAFFLVLLLALGVGTSPRKAPIHINLVPAKPTPTAPARASTTRAPAVTAAVQPPTARTRPGSAVRTAPSTTGLLLAELPSGQVLPILGRSQDNAWLLVQFSASDAPGVQRAGWVLVSTVDVSGDLQSVAVVSAAEPPTVAPSSTATPSPTPVRTSTPAATSSATAVQSPAAGAALPDLALQDFGLITVGPGAGFLRVDVANYGQRDLVQQAIEIAGFDQTGAQVLRLTTGPLTIAAGSFQSVVTGYKPTQRTMLTVVINPNHTIAEADAPAGFDDPNNSLTKAITPP